MNQPRRSKNNEPEILVTRKQAPNNKNNNRGQTNRQASNVKTTPSRRPNRSGVVGSKQLESIQSLLQRNSETASKEPTLSQLRTTSKKNARIPLSDDDIIQSVMHKVAELNQDKLPEASLVKVLADVYLDAKSKLKKTPEQHHAVSTSDDVVPCSAAKTEPLVLENSVPATFPTSVIQPAPLSVSEKKRLKWEQEKAELAALAAQTPWGANTVYSSTTRPSRPSQPLPTADSNPQRPSVPLIENPHDSYSLLNNQFTENPMPSLSSTGIAVPALTPLAFAAHQDAEQLKREQQRRQWKNALDEQIKEQRVLREKQLLEERQKHLALLNQLQTGTGLEPRIATTVQVSPNINPFPNPATAPLLQSHPSASHFSASIPIPDLMCPDPGIAAAIKPPCQFNRTRGFTQSLYSSPADEAARLRRAEEIQRANLEQIEEHRRLRELERANRLLEDKLEEERLERERARLQAIAEAENREKHLREMEETTREQFLFDNLKQAREEAASYRTQVRFRRSIDQPNQPCRVQNADGNQTPAPQQPHLNPSAQVNLGNTYTVNLDNLVDRAQVPLVTSSVGDCEDAACQTDPVSIISPNQSPPRAKSSGGNSNTRENQYPAVGQTRRKIANTNNNVVESSRRQPPSKRLPDPTHKVGGNRRTPETAGASRVDRPIPKSDRLRALRTNGTSYTSHGSNASPPQSSTELVTNKQSNKGQLVRQHSDPSSNVTKARTSVSSTMSGRNPTRIPVPVSSLTQKPVVRPADPLPSTPPITRYTDDLPVTQYPTDLVRTQDILTPIDGDVAVPVSRVNTGKQATRQSYLVDHVLDPPKSQREQPTQRQNSILQHLSEIRKSLQMRQMLYESGTYDDDDDVYGAEFGD